MLYFPVNFIRGTATKLQFRLAVAPWLKWNDGIISCAKRRDYSSSSPVNYIPKISSTNVKNEAASMPLSYLEKKPDGSELNMVRADMSQESSQSFCEVNSKNHDSFLTSDVNCGLNMEMEEEIGGDLMTVSKEFIDVPEIQSIHSLQDVEKSAIKLLASRATTATELKKKLKGKKFPVETIDTVITNLQSRGLINDGLYAESYSRSRWSSSSWGPRRIKQGLSTKGIKKADADEAIKLVFKDDDDQDSGTSISKVSMDQLCVRASKQWQKSHGAPKELRKTRMVRWLQYRGFGWDVINYVLKQLQSENPS